MKKVILSIILLLFSFYYTNKVSEYIKNKDPIMNKIKEEYKKYEYNSINAKIDNDLIIPGKIGKKVDINKSYYKMKKLSYYTDSLYVYKDIIPNISINNQYDKLIIKGNPYNKNIGIILKLNDLDLLNTIKKYPNLNIILPYQLLNNKKLINLKNNIIILETNDYYDNINYCYVEENFQKLCLDNKIYTISPTFINTDLYYNTYINLENGKMFVYNITNEKNLEKVLLILSSIKNLGYKIVSIDELIKE